MSTMGDSTGKLSRFLSGVDAYFRSGEEASFPWHERECSVWYALLVVEEGQIRKYGFTSSDSGKAALCQAIRSLSANDEALLLGVWTGTRRTDLFVLEKSLAIDHLVGAKRYDRFKHLLSASNVELAWGKRSQRKHLRYLRYSYERPDGTQVNDSTSVPTKAKELVTFFKANRIRVQERTEPG